MNPTTDPLYAGIADVHMASDRFELGGGLVLERTYAHLMAPFLMAFAPAEEGKPHPRPWSAVSDGLAADIHIQLHVPASFDEPSFFDRLNTVWWIVALMRLRGATSARVVVIADRPFAEIPANWKNARMIPLEVLPRHIAAESAIGDFSEDDLTWLKTTWLSGGHMMGTSTVFNDAFQALDAAGGMPTSAVALLVVWGALEQLFSPARQELRFRVAANIAAYLEPPGPDRLSLHRCIMRLYDARSSVAHGGRSKSPGAWLQTYELANRVLLKILADGSVPSKKDLECMLFTLTTPREST